MTDIVDYPANLTQSAAHGPSKAEHLKKLWQDFKMPEAWDGKVQIIKPTEWRNPPYFGPQVSGKTTFYDNSSAAMRAADNVLSLNSSPGREVTLRVTKNKSPTTAKDLVPILEDHPLLRKVGGCRFRNWPVQVGDQTRRRTVPATLLGIYERSWCIELHVREELTGNTMAVVSRAVERLVIWDSFVGGATISSNRDEAVTQPWRPHRYIDGPVIERAREAIRSTTQVFVRDDNEIAFEFLPPFHSPKPKISLQPPCICCKGKQTVEDLDAGKCRACGYRWKIKGLP